MAEDSIMSKYNENGTIDTEINHPEFGLIPITVSADDPETADLFNQLKDTAEPYIAPVPTAEEIKASSIAKLKQARDLSLSELTYTLADGSVYQVRPKDVPNYQLAIQLGVDTNWILADDTVRYTTITELQEVVDSGIQQGKAVWDSYINAIKGM